MCSPSERLDKRAAMGYNAAGAHGRCVGAVTPELSFRSPLSYLEGVFPQAVSAKYN